MNFIQLFSQGREGLLKIWNVESSNTKDPGIEFSYFDNMERKYIRSGRLYILQIFTSEGQSRFECSICF